MEKNTKMEQKKLKTAKKEKASRPKKKYKRKVEETYPLPRFITA